MQSKIQVDVDSSLKPVITISSLFNNGVDYHDIRDKLLLSFVKNIFETSGGIMEVHEDKGKGNYFMKGIGIIDTLKKISENLKDNEQALIHINVAIAYLTGCDVKQEDSGEYTATFNSK